MRVRRLTASDDWTFGKGKADYLRRSDAIKQNVVTRLKSFVNDWFADIDAGLPWIEMLTSRQNRDRILREVEKTVLSTQGVRSIEKLQIIDVDINRQATIEMTVTDVFNEQFTETVIVL